jgi:hypothetical protein
MEGFFKLSKESPMRTIITGCAVALLLAVTPHAALAQNTLSRAYAVAYSDPKGFEWYILAETDETFAGKFAKCAQLSDPMVAGAIKSLETSHKNCKENSECDELAKQIGVMREAKDNVALLASYVASMGKKNTDFKGSAAGQRALTAIEVFMTTTGTSYKEAVQWIQAIPYFKGVLRILGTVPCQ